MGLGLVVGGSYYLWDQYRFGQTAAHANGTIVEVLYDPDHPQRAQLGVTASLVVGGVFTTIGLLFATGAVYSIVRAVSRRRGQRGGS